MHFINNPDFSRDLTIFIISFIFSFKIVNVVLSDPNIFLRMSASVADAAAVDPNGIKTFLANAFNTFFIKGNPGFSNGPKRLPNKLCG